MIRGSLYILRSFRRYEARFGEGFSFFTSQSSILFWFRFLVLLLHWGNLDVMRQDSEKVSLSLPPNPVWVWYPLFLLSSCAVSLVLILSHTTYSSGWGRPPSQKERVHRTQQSSILSLISLLFWISRVATGYLKRRPFQTRQKLQLHLATAPCSYKVQSTFCLV